MCLLFLKLDGEHCIWPRRKGVQVFRQINPYYTFLVYFYYFIITFAGIKLF